MIKPISGDDVTALMASDELFAVFDVRERGEYNECQISDTTSLPRSQIEFRIAELVPNRRIPIVLYDDGGERAPLAAKTLTELGYEHISILQGGLAAWRNEGRPTISGVNVPSKAFGEKVYHENGVPDVSPEQLKAWLDGSAKPVILDMRTPEEYGRFCIPGGVNVPGGELILWAEELREKPLVVVNCAGRTRSIIGAAALGRLGLTNVKALRNGTMGWLLAGFELETKPGRAPASPGTKSKGAALALAERVRREEGIAELSAQELMSATADSGPGATYLIDVRSESEYDLGHIAGSISVPGGQAVQRADDFVAVRNARIVFISALGARATMAAYWYRRMGFPKVYVLQDGVTAWTGCGGKLASGVGSKEPLGIDAAKRVARRIDANALRGNLRASSALILDVGTSLEFEAGHLPEAKWISRGWLEIIIPERYPDRGRAIVLTCHDGVQSVFAARALGEIGYQNVSVLDGGVDAWRAAGFPTEKGLDGCLAETNDVVLSPSVRGNKEDMQRYLDWETRLPH
jgi:rhodanese-related sulfurtransferase